MRRLTSRRWRIGTRLLLAQGLVLLAAVTTAAAIAAIIGPPLFHQHMLEADRSPNRSELDHVERAYRAVNLLSLGISLPAAILLALAVSWYLTRRFQAPLTTLRGAAADVAQGHYGTLVQVGAAGPELEALADAFNTMSTRLASTEETRRRLLSDLAHELRTPTATLHAYLEGLDDGVREWDQPTRRVLADQVARLTRLADDLDGVSRAEEGRLAFAPERVDVADLIAAAVGAVGTAYDDKRVHLKGAELHAAAFVDRTRLLQVLTNLLDNALRHTPPGGSVTIDAQHVHDQVVIAITDTGEGIPPSQLPHIFERFYRGDTARDRDGRGSGIGLTISRAIVEAHGGHLTARSDGPGFGATFTVEVPARRTSSSQT